MCANVRTGGPVRLQHGASAPDNFPRPTSPAERLPLRDSRYQGRTRGTYHRGLDMDIDTERNDREAVRQERSIELLTRVARAPPDEVRGLLANELARLGRDAKVHKYLHVLATSNVRGMLLRRARRERPSAGRG